jgi:signal transduction histidine kinase
LAHRKQRVIPTLGLAVLIPMIIFLSLQFGFSYRAERAEVETATLERARRIMSNVDASLERSIATLRVLMTIRSIRSQDWEEADSRSREIAALNPDWKSVRIWDLDAGRELVDTERPFAPSLPLDPGRLKALPVTRSVVVGGIDRECVCIHLAATVMNDTRRFMLIVNLNPSDFQQLLVDQAPKEGVTAIVDQGGYFIARTLNYTQRVGTPATHFLRDAIKRSDSGVYSGKTWEGLDNYTAFATSRISGWSTHVAVSSSVIDGPQRLWRIAVLVAGILSMLLAVGLLWLGYRMLSAQRMADERLEQAQRLEAIGKLTGGIAHDFNNMLAVIMGSLDIAKRRLNEGSSEIERYVDNAMEGARRAAELTRRLLAFSRRQALMPATIEVNALIQQMRDLLDRSLDANILVDCRFGDNVWLVHADPGQLENALLNLAVNARDAMPNGGVLTIRTENIAASGTFGDRVRIAVSDTGTGMTPEVKAKAFEPFFSTKGIGKGTGLGLSQIYGFAQQSGGTAEIESKVGEGTTVSLLLPRAPGVQKPDIPAPSSTEVARGRPDETILVVEDEEDVRHTTAQALKDLGYTVQEAADGEEALARLRQGPGIRLLFTDIMMPGIDGRALATEALIIDPRLKILFTTGYEQNDRPEADEVRTLRKPYGFPQLARAIRMALDQ